MLLKLFLQADGKERILEYLVAPGKQIHIALLDHSITIILDVQQLLPVTVRSVCVRSGSRG
jgi:hypothetical protein